MMSTAVELESGFVLHTYPYRETSLLVEVFSRSAGRVGMIAKGARRATSPLRGVLQPFSPLLLSWRRGRDLCPLTGAERCAGNLQLGKAVLMNGFYMNELLLRLVRRHDPHPELFDAYREALGRLQVDDPVEPVLRVYEKRLLQAIGYGVILDCEVDSGALVVADRMYSYLADVGPVTRRVENLEGARISGAALQALAREVGWTPELLAQCKRLMRYLIAQQLEGRELKTRALFRQTRFRDAV